jgi:hypothetical protein
VSILLRQTRLRDDWAAWFGLLHSMHKPQMLLVALCWDVTCGTMVKLLTAFYRALSLLYPPAATCCCCCRRSCVTLQAGAARTPYCHLLLLVLPSCHHTLLLPPLLLLLLLQAIVRVAAARKWVYPTLSFAAIGTAFCCPHTLLLLPPPLLLLQAVLREAADRKWVYPTLSFAAIGTAFCCPHTLLLLLLQAILREAAGRKWVDPTLSEWPENDFRIFVGDLGNEVNDDALGKAFQRYPSFAKAKVRCSSRLSVLSSARHCCSLLEASCVIGLHLFGPKRQLLWLCAVWLW